MKSFFKNNIIPIFFGTFLSKFIGFIRQVFIAGAYGIGIAYDAYNYAYIIPGFLIIIISGINGPLHNALVAVLTPLKTKEAAIILNQVSLKITVILLLIGCLIFLKADFIIPFLAPNLNNESQIIAIQQLKILSPCIPLSGFIGLSYGALNTKNKFLISSLSPSIISLVTVIFIAFSWLNNFQDFGISYLSKSLLLATATLAGTTIQFFIQLYEIYKIGLLDLKITLMKATHEEKRILNLILPASLASGLGQINVFVDMFFISSFRGAASGLAYGNLLIQAPLGILSNTLILPLLPKFSKLINKNKKNQVKQILIEGIENCFLLTIFLGGLLITFSGLIVELVFQRGAFDNQAVFMVQKILIAYAVGIPFYLYRDLLIRFYYSIEKTKLPFQISLVGIILNIIFDWLLTGAPTINNGNLLSFNYGAVGVVLSSGFVNLIVCSILSLRLSKNNYDIPNLLILKKVVFKVISSIFASSISLSLLNQIYYARNSFISKITLLVIGFAVFTLIYYVLTKFFKVNKLYLKSKI